MYQNCKRNCVRRTPGELGRQKTVHNNARIWHTLNPDVDAIASTPILATTFLFMTSS